MVLVFPQPDFEDHALVDSGAGEKLERFGPVLVRRPDPQALWPRRLGRERWSAAEIAFERDPASGGRRGRWVARAGEPPREWAVRWRELVCLVRPTPFKHLGLFPEQAANWAWVAGLSRSLGERPRLLNLFGYTGSASIAAVQAGFEVTHVDASRTSLAWARDNARASGLGEEAFRVLLDDALAFARREVRRGARYQGVLLDPPHHGRGPKGEVWQLEEHLAPLVETCRDLLAPVAFAVLSVYAVGWSPLGLANVLAELPGGEIEAAELALREEAEGAAPARRLPCGFCARWWRGVAAPREAAGVLP